MAHEKGGKSNILILKYPVPSETPGVTCALLAVWGLAAVFLELGHAVGALSHPPHPG